MERYKFLYCLLQITYIVLFLNKAVRHIFNDQL